MKISLRIKTSLQIKNSRIFRYSQFITVSCLSRPYNGAMDYWSKNVNEILNCCSKRDRIVFSNFRLAAKGNVATTSFYKPSEKRVRINCTIMRIWLLAASGANS